MMRIELLADGQVVNTIVADSLEAAQSIFGFDACRMAAVQDAEAVLTVRELPKVQYLKRFTQAERIAIRALGQTVPEVNDYIELLNAVTDFVHLDDPDTVDGLAKLELVGAIGPGRAAEIRA